MLKRMFSSKPLAEEALSKCSKAQRVTSSYYNALSISLHINQLNKLTQTDCDCFEGMSSPLGVCSWRQSPTHTGPLALCGCVLNSICRKWLELVTEHKK